MAEDGEAVVSRSAEKVVAVPCSGRVGREAADPASRRCSRTAQLGLHGSHTEPFACLSGRFEDKQRRVHMEPCGDC